MKHKPFTYFVAVMTLMVHGCASQPPFGEDFDDDWSEGNFNVTWSSDIGPVTKHHSLQLVDGKLCVADGSGRVLAVDATSGETAIMADLNVSVKGNGACTGRKITLVTDANDLVVVDPRDGNEEWRLSLDSSLLGTPILIGNTLVIVQANGTVLAYSLIAGEQLWRLGLRENIFRFDGVFKTQQIGNDLYLGSPEGTLYAIDTINGFVIWENRLFDTRDPDPTANITLVAGPAVTGNLVCAAAFNGFLACYERSNGRMAWTRPVSSSSTVATDGEKIFVMDNRGALLAYSIADGEELWETNKASANRSSVLVHHQGEVWFDNGFSGLSAHSAATGELVAGIRLPGGLIDAVPVDNGMIILTADGGLYRLERQ